DDYHSERGTLFFSDFVHPHPRPDNRLLRRIKLNPATHAAEEKMLMEIDSPFRYGEPAVFDGHLRCIFPDAAQLEEPVKLLRAGFCWLAQLGAERTVGFGRVHSFELLHLHVTGLTPQTEEPFAQIKAAVDTLTCPAEPVSRTYRHPCKIESAL